jgi:hypothetical protein
MHAARRCTRLDTTRLRRTLCGAALFAAATAAYGYTATLNPESPQTVYLQVGVGNFTNCYTCNPQGQPENNTTINSESVTVAGGGGRQRRGRRP